MQKRIIVTIVSQRDDKTCVELNYDTATHQSEIIGGAYPAELKLMNAIVQFIKRTQPKT
jgi:hypothetical protein